MAVDRTGENPALKIGYYTVQKGDTYSEILDDNGIKPYTGSLHTEIAEQSNIKDENKIYVGDEILFDAGTVKKQTVEALKSLGLEELEDLDSLNSAIESYQERTGEAFDFTPVAQALEELESKYSDSDKFDDEKAAILELNSHISQASEQFSPKEEEVGSENITEEASSTSTPAETPSSTPAETPAQTPAETAADGAETQTALEAAQAAQDAQETQAQEEAQALQDEIEKQEEEIAYVGDLRYEGCLDGSDDGKLSSKEVRANITHGVVETVKEQVNDFVNTVKEHPGTTALAVGGVLAAGAVAASIVGLPAVLIAGGVFGIFQGIKTVVKAVGEGVNSYKEYKNATTDKEAKQALQGVGSSIAHGGEGVAEIALGASSVAGGVKAAQAAAGAVSLADDVAKTAANAADDVARITANSADDVARIAAENADDVARIAANSADDVAKTALSTVDDAAETALSTVDDAAKAAAGAADDVAQTALSTVDDAAETALSTVDDTAKAAAGAADDAAKAAAGATDDAAKAAAGATDDAAKAAANAASEAEQIEKAKALLEQLKADPGNKKLYRELAKLTHPDSNVGKTEETIKALEEIMKQAGNL